VHLPSQEAPLPNGAEVLWVAPGPLARKQPFCGMDNRLFGLLKSAATIGARTL
jgi:hypothetical protein